MTNIMIPKQLWDFGLFYEDEMLSRISRGKDKRTGCDEVTGQTQKIGDYLDFEFYNLACWWD